MKTPETTVASFSDLNLPAPLLAALDDVGYETPSPIQARAIPHLLQGLDLLGHAPTGTGKTAAFALPLLANIETKDNKLQILVLTPTRELAIQVAEAFRRYASQIKGFRVVPIYGGQDYSTQLRQLSRGVHAVVGTPGRIMDHMRKGTLKLGNLQSLVLDEADEMLRMGFIDDVEWILDQTPSDRQMALFSATMPKQIQRIAMRHLQNPQEITVKGRTATAETIRQRYWLVSGLHKLDALTRILEVETFDAMLIFVRTKTATAELAEKLEARGYAAAAMNGDMVQKQREKMVERLKRGSLDILVATDVAARGLDVERISHVVNFDIPYDTEAYIHRIGRTGRAGREGEAILFVTPRERRLLGSIEKATRQKISELELPTTEMVNNKRIADFKQQISDTLARGELAFMRGLVEQYEQEHDVPAHRIAAALAKMALGDKPLLLKAEKRKKDSHKRDTDNQSKSGKPANARQTTELNKEIFVPKQQRPNKKERPLNTPHHPESGMERFRLEVGADHDVKPGNIVGAIANEAGIDAFHIGRIDIQSDHSLVDLPEGMPKSIFRDLKKTWVCGQRINISRIGDKSDNKQSVKKDAKNSEDRGHQRAAIGNHGKNKSLKK